MAPQPRVDVPSGIYEAMLRGNSGQDIFFEPEDWGELYHLLAEGKVRFEYRLHAYCLMSNPVHLAVEVGGIPLSPGVQNLAFRYTRWINRREERMGHLFQGRYKALLVDRDAYLLEAGELHSSESGACRGGWGPAGRPVVGTSRLPG
jgi:putative transposase